MIEEERRIGQLTLEQYYLSAALIDIDVLSFLKSSGIGPDLFENEFCQQTLAAMLDMEENGMSVDIQTLGAYFADKGMVENIPQVMDLALAVSTTSHASSHFRVLKDRWKMRNLKMKTLKLQEVAKNASWEEVRSQVCEIANSIIDNGVEEDKRSQKDIVRSAIAETKRIIEGKEPLNSVTVETGIECIDRYLRPLSTSTADYVNYIFAATSTGKSSLMAQIVSHNVRKGLRGAVFLGETDSEGFYKQMTSQIVKVALDPYDLKKEPSDRQAVFLDCLERWEGLADKNLWMYDDDFYVEDLIMRAKRLAKEFGGLDFIVADHLHCMKTRKSFKDERLKFNYMSSLIKPLGLLLKCPVIVLAQPSRGFKSDARPPMVSDLKESGNLEDDADRIWALYLPPKDSEGVDQDRQTLEPQIELHQLKFRKGRTGTVKLRLQKPYTRFYDDHIKTPNQ